MFVFNMGFPIGLQQTRLIMELNILIYADLIYMYCIFIETGTG